MADIETIRATIKEEFEKINTEFKKEFTNTNAKIESIDEKVNNVNKTIKDHNTRISTLEDYSTADNRRIDKLTHQIEILKQDRLKNNVRLTGLPTDSFADTNATVMKIIDVLQLNLLPSEFISYADEKKTSIILAFQYQSNKRLFMNTLRARRELLVEEVFPSARSNSKIYCNDQLTPHFAGLFNEAWKAKKNNLLHSASSLGGRVKVKKFENSIPIVIVSEEHLSEIIGSSATMETSNANTNGSPHSAQSIQNIQTNAEQHNLPSASVINRGTTNQTANNTQSHSHTERSRTEFNRSGDIRGPNRSTQWQELRSKPPQRQNYHNHRSQQQDRTRHIEFSPNQYRQQQRHGPPRTVRYNTRNYNPRPYDDFY